MNLTLLIGVSCFAATIIFIRDYFRRSKAAFREGVGIALLLLGAVCVFTPVPAVIGLLLTPVGFAFFIVGHVTTLIRENTPRTQERQYGGKGKASRSVGAGNMSPWRRRRGLVCRTVAYAGAFAILFGFTIAVVDNQHDGAVYVASGGIAIGIAMLVDRYA